MKIYIYVDTAFLMSK